ncbi:MAG: hypothetical protein ACYSTS_18040 [Planctomycetota bacterium]
MKRNIKIYDLVSALNEDIGENECGTVMIKLVCLITNYSCNIKMWTTTSLLPEDTK